VRVQQVDHRPQVAAFLDVDLEDVAQVVERRARAAEMALLLDRGGLGVALGHDEPAQRAAILAGTSCQAGVPLCSPKAIGAVRLGLGQEDAPAVLRHPHPVEVRPALRVDADRRAQVDVLGLEPVGPHLVPPVQVARLPLLQRAQQARLSARLTLLGMRSV
jgi:hypothetical protein